MNIGHFSYMLIPQKLDVNTFSGSIRLWRLLRDSAPMEILLWCRRRLQSERGVQKLVKFYFYYDFWAVFVHFLITKVGNDNIYWKYKFMEIL